MAWPSVLLPEVASQVPVAVATDKRATVVPQTFAASAIGTCTVIGTAMLLRAAIWFLFRTRSEPLSGGRVWVWLDFFGHALCAELEHFGINPGLLRNKSDVREAVVG